MKLNYMELLFPISQALDVVEHDAAGALPGHGRRVGYLAVAIAQRLGVEGDELRDLAALGLLHDNAIAEYERNERAAATGGGRYCEMAPNGVAVFGVDTHVVLGERNVEALPFLTDVSGVVLTHHECADGSGPLGLMGDEVDPRAQLIHVVDRVDANFDLNHLSPAEFDELLAWVDARRDTMFTGRMADAFLSTVSWDMVRDMQKHGAEAMLKRIMAFHIEELSDEEVRNVAAFFVHIIDCKSSFTMSHSRGVAQKVYRMAVHYGLDHDKAERLYFAGALHDVGKLFIDRSILEKPSRLTSSEFEAMKEHVRITYDLLAHVEGLEDIREWAGNHHEKLDGSGYCRGLCGSDLSFEDRLLACTDIYQALTERRPYKEGYTHNEALAIMRKQARAGKIDANMVEEFDKVFGENAGEQ